MMTVTKNRGVEPRRSERVHKLRKKASSPQEGEQSHSASRNTGVETRQQSRPRGRPPKNALSTAPRRPLDGTDEAEGVASGNMETNLPFGNDRAIPEIGEIPYFPPPPSPTRTGTTRTSDRVLPSRVKGIKRDHLVNLSPTIKFETVAEGKKHWPSHVQTLWRDQVSSLVHETRVVPPRLKAGVPLLCWQVS